MSNVPAFCCSSLVAEGATNHALNIPHIPTRSEGAKAPLPTQPYSLDEDAATPTLQQQGFVRPRALDDPGDSAQRAPSQRLRHSLARSGVRRSAAPR